MTVVGGPQYSSRMNKSVNRILRALGAQAWYTASGPKDVTTAGSAIGSVTDLLGISPALTQSTAASKPLLMRGDNLENRAHDSEFQNAGAHSVVRTTINRNSATAPNGLSTAATLVEDNTTNYRITGTATAYKMQGITGLSHVDSFYIKPNGRIKFDWYTNSDASHCQFTLTGGGSVGTVTGGTATITALANSWYYCTVTYTMGATSLIAPYIQFASDAGASTYLGDGVSGYITWGWQSRLASTSSTYVATTTPQYAGFGSRYVPAMYFDGANDQLVGATINLVGAKTIIGAVRTYSVAGADKCWFSQSSSYNLALTHYNGNSVHNYHGGGGADSNGACTNNADHILSFVHDGTTNAGSLTGYVDGAAIAAATSATTGYNSSFLVGDVGGGGKPWLGPIESILIFNRALSTSERQWVERFLGARCGITVA